MPKQSAWYSARCIFLHADLPAKRGDNVYEERVILLRATNLTAALRLAQRDATKYTRAHEKVTFLGFTDLFCLSDRPGHLAEVFSLMRVSRMRPSRYLDRFFDTGRERRSRL